MTATHKLHVFDSGLPARLQRLISGFPARADPTAVTELGHLVETVAVNDLLK